MLKRHAILSKNVKNLIAHRGTTLVIVADDTGIPLSLLLALTKDEYKAPVTIEVVDKLAQHFKLKPFQLLIPELPMDDLFNCAVKLAPLGRRKRKIILTSKKRLFH